MTTPPASDWLDVRGCLTDAGVSAVTAAPVGGVPEALAAHLARCARCQQKLLGGGAARPPARPAPSLRRMLITVGLVLAAILGLLLSIHWLSGPRP
jgi:hypothetical protein